MPFTPNFAIPYQTLADPPDGPNLGEDGFLAVDGALVGLDARLDALEGAVRYTRIAETVLGSAQASVTFSSIPATYRGLELHILGRGDAATQYVNVRMRFNSDSTAVYDHEQVYGAGATPGAGEVLSDTSLLLGDMPGSTCLAGSCASFIVNVPHYTDAAFWQATISEKTLMSQTSAGQSGQLWRKSWSGRWRATAAVNRIDVINGSGNFVAGSIFTLYGLP